jgi:hypothetical protein
MGMGDSSISLRGGHPFLHAYCHDDVPLKRSM